MPKTQRDPGRPEDSSLDPSVSRLDPSTPREEISAPDQRTLWQSEKRFHRLFESSIIGLFVTDRSGRIADANDAFLATVGYTREDLSAGRLRWDEMTPPEYRHLYEIAIEAIRRTGAAKPWEKEYIRKDGTRVPVLVGVALLEPPKEDCIVFVVDLSERKRAEETRARWAAIVESSDDAILSETLDGIVTSWNQGAEGLYGYSASEAIGRHVGFHVPSDRRGEIDAILHRIRAGESVYHLETVRQRRNGEQVDVSLTVSPIHDAAGGIAGASVIARDITERKHAEKSIQKLLRAVEQAENAIFMTDLDGVVTYVNPAFERTFGFSKEEALGKTPRILKSGQYDQAFYERLWKRLLAGETVHGEIVNKTRDGQLVTVAESINPVSDADGKRIGFIAVMNDVSEKKLLEQQLRQAQKMEAVGRLAGGVAHDFNNLLTAILGYSGLLLAQNGLPEHVKEAITEVHKAGERASSLTRQLLAFSRKQVLVPEILDLNAIVRDLEKMLRRLIGEDVTLMTSLDPRLGTVRADPGQIEQAVVNLIVNSRDAMPRGGTVTITTNQVELDRAFVKAHSGSRAGPHAMISVKDTGVGMDAETRSHLFEPFFTTKEKGKGTGLGLATVYGIVKQSGGYISVESEPGQGAEFRIYLPSVEGALRAADRPGVEPSAAAVRHTILLVEDDELVGRLTKLVLERGGYEVVSASNAAEALSHFEKFQGKISLVLTDMVMPGMSGRELVRRLASSGRSVRALYMSGYTADILAPEDAIESREQLLQKPFTPDVLLRRVREVLDRPWPARF